MSGQKKSGVPWMMIIAAFIIMGLAWWFFLRSDAASAPAQPVTEGTPIVETAAPATSTPAQSVAKATP